MSTPRSLEVRVSEYRDNLVGIAAQLQDVADRLENAGEFQGVEGLRDGARLYALIAEDLTKVISGEELKPFQVSGELP